MSTTTTTTSTRKRKLGAPSPSERPVKDKPTLAHSAAKRGSLGLSRSGRGLRSGRGGEGEGVHPAARTLAHVSAQVAAFLASDGLDELCVKEGAGGGSGTGGVVPGEEFFDAPGGLPTRLPEAWRLILHYQAVLDKMGEETAGMLAAAERADKVDEITVAQAMGSLKAQIQRLQTQIQEADILASEEKAGDEDRYQSALQEIEDLKAQRRVLMEKMKDAEESAKNEMEAAQASVEEAQNKAAALADRVGELEVSLAEALAERDTAVQAAEEMETNAAAERDLAVLDREKLEAEAELSRAQREEALEKAAQAVEDAAGVRSELEALRATGAQSEGMQQEVIELRAELSRLGELEAQISALQVERDTLQAGSENTQLLHERIHELEAAAAVAAETSVALQDAESRLAKLEEERSAWASLLSDHDMGGSFGSPASMVEHMVELQDQVLVLKASASSSSTEVKLKDSAASAMGADLIRKAQELEMYVSAQDELTAQVKRAERRARVAEAELAGARSMLAVYEAEDEADVEITWATKVSALEASVANLTQELEATSSERDQAAKAKASLLRRAQEAEAVAHGVDPTPIPMALTEAYAGSSSPAKASPGKSGKSGEVEGELARMREQTLVLTRENEKLGAALIKAETLAAKYEAALGSGSFNTKTTKVLHFKHNPEAAAKAAAAKAAAAHVVDLEEENALLKSQVEALTSGDASSLSLQAPAGPAVPGHLSELQDRVRELEAQVAQAGTKNRRLKEVFGKMSAEFKEVTYLLLGFQIDMKDQGRFRLRSMYAEHKDDVLYFSKSEEGDMHLLETPFAASLGPEVDAYLRRCHSIPAFLSHVTMKLFNSVTTQ